MDPDENALLMARPKATLVGRALPNGMDSSNQDADILFIIEKLIKDGSHFLLYLRGMIVLSINMEK